MADINIEKKRSSVWPWIIGLVLLAAVVYAAWMFLGDTDAETTDADLPMQEYEAPPAPAPAPPPVQMDTTAGDTIVAGTESGAIGP